MNKKLPEMFHNNFNKEINNNERMYTTMNKKVNDNETYKFDKFSIEQKIFNIFNSKDYIYKADVVIVTDGGSFEKRIIGKNSSNLITMDNEYIPISTIRDIYKK